MQVRSARSPTEKTPWKELPSLEGVVETEFIRPILLGESGKDERHIDKHVWKLPIPLFDDNNPTHCRLSDLGGHCADLVAGLDLGDSGNFVTLRRRIRATLATDTSASEINEIVLELLST